MLVLLVLLAIPAALALWAISVYNRLVALRQQSALGFANIDVLLKQRNDELPKLVEICKRHMQFERATLEAVTQARSRIAGALDRRDMGALADAEADLRGALSQVYAVAEAYPELKSDAMFSRLQMRISELESQIADRRESYNEAVNIYNVAIAQIPASIVANNTGFRPADLLKFSAAETADVNLGALFEPQAQTAAIPPAAVETPAPTPPATPSEAPRT